MFLKQKITKFEKSEKLVSNDSEKILGKKICEVKNCNNRVFERNSNINVSKIAQQSIKWCSFDTEW